MEAKLSFSPKLFEAANAVAKKVLALRRGERALIITNPIKDVMEISQALYKAFAERGALPTLIIQPVKSSFDYMNAEVRSALASEPQVVCSISFERLGKDPVCLKNPLTASDGKTYDSLFEFLLAEKKIRAVWTPGITKRIFAETVPINYGRLRRRCALIKERLTGASEVKVQTSKGMDFSFSVKGREPKVDDGNFAEPGRGGNLPAGEIFVSPAVGSSEGTIVIDGSISMEKTTLVKTPIKIEVKDGYAAKILGGPEAKTLSRLIQKAAKLPFRLAEEGILSDVNASEYSKNARHVGEFGIGLNDKAKVRGNVLEDEKALGTVHVALGSNYDEDAKALIHYDGVIKKPTVWIDGELLIEEGKLRV